MKYRQLGRTGLKVSEVSFGCWAIGGSGYGVTRDEESLEALETAFRHGVNFFDTADTYGHGHSEELLSKFIQGKPRGEFLIASKAGWDFYHGGSKKNFDPEYIRFACEKSLLRLSVDTIDVYQLHNPSLELIKNKESIRVLEELKKEGKIRFAGISVHSEEEALEAMADGRVDTLQVAFNILDQRMALAVFEDAKKNNIGMIVREPLACGLLTGKYTAEHEFPKEDHRRRWTREKLEVDMKKIQKVRAILGTGRLTLARAALEFVLEHDAVSCVIPGAKTKVQALENLQAVENAQLRIEEASRLRELFYREEIFRQGLPGSTSKT